MKITTSTVFLLFISTLTFGQLKEGEGIKMTAKYASENDDLTDLLSFEEIDYFKINFTGASLIGKNYALIAKEIWNGVITKTDTLINTAANERMEKLSSDTLSFKVLAKKTVEQKLKMYFIFPRFRFNRAFDATTSDDYSLRVTRTKMKIEPDKAFYALAYILPYEKDGWKYWCAVDSSGEDVENWGKEFGIKHYLVFEMKFE